MRRGPVRRASVLTRELLSCRTNWVLTTLWVREFYFMIRRGGRNGCLKRWLLLMLPCQGVFLRLRAYFAPPMVILDCEFEALYWVRSYDWSRWIDAMCYQSS